MRADIIRRRLKADALVAQATLPDDEPGDPTPFQPGRYAAARRFNFWQFRHDYRTKKPAGAEVGSAGR